MNGLMHPEDMVEYARRHHDEIQRLVETERMFKPKRAMRPGYRERFLLRLSDLLIKIGLHTDSKVVESNRNSTCDETGACVV